jgi:hypothetical protein
MEYERYHLVNKYRGGSLDAVTCFTDIAPFYT